MKNAKEVMSCVSISIENWSYPIHSTSLVPLVLSEECDHPEESSGCGLGGDSCLCPKSPSSFKSGGANKTEICGQLWGDQLRLSWQLGWVLVLADSL